jgi:hypothetical protein
MRTHTRTIYHYKRPGEKYSKEISREKALAVVTKNKLRIKDASSPLQRDVAVFAQDKRLSAQEGYTANLVGVTTAGDDAVCFECEDFAAGSPYDIDEALDTLPLHPGCRCALVPWGEDDIEDSLVSDFNPYHEPAGSSAVSEPAQTYQANTT